MGHGQRARWPLAESPKRLPAATAACTNPPLFENPATPLLLESPQTLLSSR